MASVILARLKIELENRLAAARDVAIDEALNAVAGAGELLKVASGAAALAVS